MISKLLHSYATDVICLLSVAVGGAQNRQVGSGKIGSALLASAIRSRRSPHLKRKLLTDRISRPHPVLHQLSPTTYIHMYLSLIALHPHPQLCAVGILCARFVSTPQSPNIAERETNHYKNNSSKKKEATTTTV